MKGDRLTVTLHFLVLVTLFPLTFVLIREATSAFFSAYSFDDKICHWIDKVFKLPTELDPKVAKGPLIRSLAGGSHRWLIEIVTLFPTLWCLRFLTGAIEEIRCIYGGASLLYTAEVLGRWLALGALLLVALPIVTVVFFDSIRFVIWEPLAFLMAMMLFMFLLVWGWQYPNRRLKHVEKVYRFKRLKDEKP